METGKLGMISVKNISSINEEYNKSKWDFVKNSNILTCNNDESLDYIK